MPPLGFFLLGVAISGVLIIIFVAMPYRDALIKAQTEMDQLRRCGRFLTPKELGSIEEGRRMHEEGAND